MIVSAVMTKVRYYMIHCFEGLFSISASAIQSTIFDYHTSLSLRIAEQLGSSQHWLVVSSCWILISAVLYLLSQQVSDSWRAFLLLSLCIQLTSWTLVIYWSRHHWHNHPICRALQAHIQPPHPGWGSVATSVNTEFRRIDKFATGAPGARVIVTDSWVLKVSEKLQKFMLQKTPGVLLKWRL